MKNENSCICGNSFRKKPFSKHFDVLFCEECLSRNFVRNNISDERNFDYNKENAKYSDPKYLKGRQLRWAHKNILRRSWKGRKVLEVGCFNGFFLDELRVRGADVYGFDLNKTAIDVGVEMFGFQGKLDTDLEKILKLGPFDDILCIDLLEHLHNPGKMVKMLSPHLNHEGQLIIAGPTVERKFHDKSDFPPHHQWWFSRNGLKKLVTRMGFHVHGVEVQRDGLLFIRNIVGRALKKGDIREFYGDEGIVAPDTSQGILGRAYNLLSYLSFFPMFVLGLSYCSTIIYARKVKDV